MSNEPELESDSAMVTPTVVIELRGYGGEFRITGADGGGYYETDSETESPSSTNPR